MNVMWFDKIVWEVNDILGCNLYQSNVIAYSIE